MYFYTNKKTEPMLFSYPVTEGNIYYNVDGKIIDCDISITDIGIPSEINRVKITSIGENVLIIVQT